MGFIVKRSFHVSPFNDRKGIYKAFCKDPRPSGYLNIKLVMYAPYSDSEKTYIYKNDKDYEDEGDAMGDTDFTKCQAGQDNGAETVDDKLEKLQFRKKLVAVLTGQSYVL